MNQDLCIGGAAARARAGLATAGIEAAGLEARLLARQVLGCDMTTLIGRPERPITPADARRLDAAVRRRSRGEPLAYILGEREFWSLSLRVSPATLIPRPDTETVVEAALRVTADHGGSLRILDLGTGSGCILLALLSERRQAWGVGVDLSADALGIARDNAQRLGLAGRAAFVRADWAAGIAGPFDLVVANPPYIADSEWDTLPTDVRAFEPSLALRGGEDGLDAYRRILPTLSQLLTPDGAALFEVGGATATGLPRLAAEMGLQVIEISTDLAGRQRCLRISAGVDKVSKNSLGNQVVPV
jgi:release factor glutamine methyltransferase